MSAVERLVITADVDDGAAHGEQVSVRARMDAVLADGRWIVLLDDRGWGSTQTWASISANDVEETTRTAIGPDEPAAGRSVEQSTTDHWTHIARILLSNGVPVDPGRLRALPCGFVMSERLAARVR
ncbi:hypothetical protein WEH80_09145 [Actinomycetes bacterium KLBMP 9759]